VNKAAKYILWRFTLANRAKLDIYPHVTQATDTSNIRLVFAAVKECVCVHALLTQNHFAELTTGNGLFVMDHSRQYALRAPHG